MEHKIHLYTYPDDNLHIAFSDLAQPITVQVWSFLFVSYQNSKFPAWEFFKFQLLKLGIIMLTLAISTLPKRNLHLSVVCPDFFFCPNPTFFLCVVACSRQHRIDM